MDYDKGWKVLFDIAGDIETSRENMKKRRKKAADKKEEVINFNFFEYEEINLSGER